MLDILVINFSIKNQLKLLSYPKIGSNIELPKLSRTDVIIVGGRSFGTEEHFMILIKAVNIKTWCLAIRTIKSIVELGCVSVEFQI